MARKELFTDVFETDTFNEWRLKTNSIKINLQDIYDELDTLDSRVVLLTGDQTINGVKSFIQKSRWTKEYTQNEVTPMLELRVTNSTNPHAQNIGHKGVGPSIDFYNPDTTTTGNTWLTSRIASITESTADILPDASLVFFTGKNTEDIVEKMRITSKGNVGIGTSSPDGAVQLSVQTANSNSIISIQSKDDKYAALAFGDSKSYKSGQIQYHNIGNSMRFFTGEATNSTSFERVRITNSGRVGIGISSPSVNLDVSGDLRTTGFIEAGRSTGGVALTMEDGYGDANVAFNHAYGKPSVNGSSARIESGVDSTIGSMIFEVGDNSIANSTRSLTQIAKLRTSLIDLYVNTKIHGKTNITGKLGVLDVDNPDYDLCVGARSDEAGHVAIDAQGGAISLRPTKNKTHRWLLNALDQSGGNFQLTSSRWNTAKNAYDDLPALSASIAGDITVQNNLSVTGNTKASQILIGNTWDVGGPQGGQSLYIKDVDVHSDYDPRGTSSSGNYILNKSKFPLIISDNNSSTSGPDSHGIVLYNASGTAGSFAPSILFAGRESNSTDFRSATAGIYCRSPLGVGGIQGATGESNTNYNDGELIFATSGTINNNTTNSQGLTQRMVIDRSGNVGIGVSAPTTTLDVAGDIKGSGNLFIGHDDIPQIIISDGTNANTEFAIYRNSTSNTMALGPKVGRGSRQLPISALTISRTAQVDIPNGGTVNVVGSADKALVNKKYVDDLVNGADQLGALTSLNLNRQDAVSEGGQLSFKRSSDNTNYWNVDIKGENANARFRISHENDNNSSVTEVLSIMPNDRVGINADNPDWDLCIGGRTTEAGSVGINADLGSISLRPSKNTTHAWMFNAFNTAGGDAAITSREYRSAFGIYRDSQILTFKKDGDVSAKGNILSLKSITAAGNVEARNNLISKNDAELGTGATRWLLHTRQNSAATKGDHFTLAPRNSTDSNWNYYSGFTQTRAGSVGIGKLPDAGYKFEVNGSIQYSVGGHIQQIGRVTPTGFNGLTTHDIYSDGGTIAVGKTGDQAVYFNKDGNGFVKTRLTLGYTPSRASDAVTKQYVDARFSGLDGTNEFTGRTNFTSAGATLAGVSNSHAGSRIPTNLTGNYAHGLGFVSKFTTTSTNDGGGILIDVSDDNGDEHAISAYNVNSKVNKEIFHVRALDGDIYSAGNFYNRGNIGTEGNITIGITTAQGIWNLGRGSGGILNLSHKTTSATTPSLTFSTDGRITLQKEGTQAKHLVTKKYVDDKVAAVTASASGNYKIVSGAEYVTSGFTNQVGSFNTSKNYFDVFPPAGYAMSDLEAFLPSINIIHFAGGVDGNDSIKCNHRVLGDRIRVNVQGTEQRSKPAASYIAVWRNS